MKGEVKTKVGLNVSQIPTLEAQLAKLGEPDWMTSWTRLKLFDS